MPEPVIRLVVWPAKAGALKHYTTKRSQIRDLGVQKHKDSPSIYLVNWDEQHYTTKRSQIKRFGRLKHKVCLAAHVVRRAEPLYDKLLAN